jgi:hypothetical protein
VFPRFQIDRQEAAMGCCPDWEEKPMRQQTRRRLFALGLMASTLWIALLIWIFWLIPMPEQSTAAQYGCRTCLRSAVRCAPITFSVG